MNTMSVITLALERLKGYDTPATQRIQVEHACPQCGHTSTIPGQQVIAWSASILTRMRRVHRGKAPVIYACPCGSFVGTAREIRSHRCAAKPPRGKERDRGLLATRKQVEAYYATQGREIPPHVNLDDYK
jgi:hypothetical protein